MSIYPNTCSICLEDILENEDNITTLDCNHPFHTKCISQIRINKCPTCRTRFTNISPDILSQIQHRETTDISSRNAENLNFVLNNFIRLRTMSFEPPESPLGLSLPPSNSSDAHIELLRNMNRSSFNSRPPPYSDRDEPIGQGRNEFTFLLQTLIRSILSDLTPPRANSSDDSIPPSLSDIVLSVMGSLLPNAAPTLFTLLNTPFQGVTLNSMLEDYIIRNTI